MNTLDWSIVLIYMAGMIAMSVYLSRGQENQADYYVGGRNLPWWAIGLSTMATQSSAISFISIPAFVALKPGGGLRILQNEFVLPLAMIFIMVLLMPYFRRLQLISIYEYLEVRFSPATRTLLASLFLFSRGLATGFGLYAIALVLSVAMQVDPAITCILLGVVTLIYDSIGGMKAVVYSDVLQMIILLGGIGVTSIYAVHMAGGVNPTLQALSVEQIQGVDFAHAGLGDGNEYNFWAMVIGGFFLYASYYGCDQTQAQRQLSAPNLADTRRSLIFNGYFRFPLVLLYAVMGVSVGAALANSAEFQMLMQPYIESKRYDYMLPVFIMNFLPHGVRALILSAILAAAMSSLDSALNSLSACTMRDFYERHFPDSGNPKRYLLWSKLTTVAWGLAVTLSAVALTRTEGLRTVIEAINQVGSFFYGPILAAFVLGVTTRKVTARAVCLGILAGVLVNAYLFRYQPGVSWLWWNPAGFFSAVLLALLVTRLIPGQAPPVLPEAGVDWPLERDWVKTYLWLVAYFVFMVGVSWAIPGLLGMGRG